MVAKLRNLIQVAVACGLLLGLLGPASAPLAPLRAQPLLLQLAAEQPGAQLSVIVQKTATDASVEARLRELGGAVTADLSMINAFAATLPAHAIESLAAAPGVRWVSLDAPMEKTGGPDGTVNVGALLNTYNKVIGADKVWAMGYQGSSITAAVVDSGLDYNNDLVANAVRIRKRAVFCSGVCGADLYGHGTYVAGIVGGDGFNSGGNYVGVAPKVKLIDVQISDDQGRSTASAVVQGLQWVLNNKTTYNIRVVNLSLNSAVAESYHTSPLSAAVEILWFNKIVVVVSAGNNGTATLYPPANDPFVITVGATDDKGTVSLSDDVVASFSAYGTTPQGFAKPDLVAPGKNIVSARLPGNNTLWFNHQSNDVNGTYFRMSGTSASAPMVAGAAALLLQDEPNLTPDQVKYRLKATANKNWAGYSAAKAGAGYLDVYAAVNGTTTQNANTGVQASQLLWTGSQPVTWSSVNWNSVNWNSVNWNSVNWNSASWNSVNWNSDYWGP